MTLPDAKALRFRQAFKDKAGVFDRQFLAQSLTILRWEENTGDDLDGYSGFVEAETVACSVSSPGPGRNAQEIVVGSRQADLTRLAVTVPSGTQVTARDRLRLDDGRILQVDGVLTTTFQVQQRLDCSEVK